MVKVRKQHQPSCHRPPSHGSPSCNHERSDKKACIQIEAEKKRSNRSEVHDRDHEVEENQNDLGDRREALMTSIEASSVPAKKAGPVKLTDTSMASLIDRVQSKGALAIPMTQITMSSIPEQYKEWPVDLQLDQDLEPDIEQLELQRAAAGLHQANDSVILGGRDTYLPLVQLQRAAAGLNLAPDFVVPGGEEWPAVQLNQCASDDFSGDIDGEDASRLDQDLVIPEGEIVPEISDESSGGRYTKQPIEELSTMTLSGRGIPVALREKEMSKIMADCILVVNREMTDEERMNYIFGSFIASKGKDPEAEIQGPKRIGRGEGRITAKIPKSQVQAEVASPPGASTLKRYHFLQSSSTINTELDEDHPSRQPEGSLLHSVYLQVLAYGQEGISIEVLLTSFHSQSLTAMLADDWEDEVINYLNCNPYFDQVQGQYILKELNLVHPSPERSAKRKEEKSLDSTIAVDHGSGGEISMQSTRKPKKKSKGKKSSDSAPRSYEGCSGEKNMQTTKGKEKRGEVIESLSQYASSSIWGSLKIMQAKIIARHGKQHGARPCSMRNHRRSPWQCPIKAMEGQKMCEHHLKLKAKNLKKSRKLKKSLRT